MRIVVIGGTGLVGRPTVEAVRRAGHSAVVISRSHGVDVATGEGLDTALAGVDSMIDVTNVTRGSAEALLSIVGLDLITGNAHYTGKRAQEALVSAGGIPFTIQRATQFHEFAGMVVDWTVKDDVALVPPLLVQPVATSDVGTVLTEMAIGTPKGRAVDLAGPQPEDLFDMARRTLAARGRSIRLIPSWRSGILGPEAAGEVFLPGPGTRLAPMTFDAWLLGQRPS